jgi:EF hand
MKSRTRTQARLAALLLGMAMLPAYAEGGMSDSGKSFKDLDSDKDGYLSVDEFKAKGKDELAFKAADIDGDQRVDPKEFDKYRARKATDPKSGPGAGGQSNPSGY